MTNTKNKKTTKELPTTVTAEKAPEPPKPSEASFDEAFAREYGHLDNDMCAYLRAILRELFRARFIRG
jgi:hypothetical protein